MWDIFSVVYNLTNETSWNSELLQQNVGNNPAGLHGRHLTRNCVTATAKTLKCSVSVSFPRCPPTPRPTRPSQEQDIRLSVVASTLPPWCLLHFKNFVPFLRFHREGSLTARFHLGYLFPHRRDWFVPRLPTDIHEFLVYDLRLKQFVILQLTCGLTATLSAISLQFTWWGALQLLSPCKFKRDCVRLKPLFVTTLTSFSV